MLVWASDLWIKSHALSAHTFVGALCSNFTSLVGRFYCVNERSVVEVTSNKSGVNVVFSRGTILLALPLFFKWCLAVELEKQGG